MNFHYERSMSIKFWYHSLIVPWGKFRYHKLIKGKTVCGEVVKNCEDYD